MAKLEAAVFSVSVDNEAEIRDWLDSMMRCRNDVESALEALVRLCRSTPLIHMTIHRTVDEANPMTSMTNRQAMGDPNA